MSQAEPGYDDSMWDTVQVGQSSGPKVFDKFDGYAWYRVKVFIPSSLKQYPRLADSIKFFLGKIDDCDQTYLNGHILGQNAISVSDQRAASDSFKNTKNLWATDRKYLVSIKDKRIIWDSVNVIAVRMFDQYGGGGLYGQAPYIGMMDLEDCVNFNLKNFYKIRTNDSVEKGFWVKNNSPHSIYEGELLANARKEELELPVFDWSSSIRLRPGDYLFISVPLPVSTDPLHFCVKFIDHQTSLVAADSVEVPYVLSSQ